jgi:hypothetical protein
MSDGNAGGEVPQTHAAVTRGEAWSQWRVRRRDRMRGREHAFQLFFKESVYASFTGFAIIVVVLVDGHADARQALVGLVLGVLGIIVAGFVAEIVAHLAVQGVKHTGSEFALVGWTAAGGLGTVITPALMLLLAATGVLPLAAALAAAIVVYVATFGVIGWLAINGAPLAWWKQLLALGGLILVGFGVVGLQALAHAV